MRTIEYEGSTYEYDETCVFNYGWQKQLASDEPQRNFRAVERLLCGKDEEVSEALGGTMEAMMGLVKAILDDNGRAAKN